MKRSDLRRAVQLWIGFLWLARMSDRSDVKEKLENSANLYRRWGNFDDVPFEQWWKAHSNIFEIVVSIRVLPPSEDDEDSGLVADSSKDELLRRITLPGTPTAFLAQIRKVVIEQRNIKSEPKSWSEVQALAVKKAPRLNHLADYLLVGSVVCEFPELHGKKLMDKVHAQFRESGQKVPSVLLEHARGINDAHRNLLRYVQRANEVMLNVAKGRFP
jgi:hypothetical protein